ncbi:MAG: ABC transporter permease, partial [Burkholderiaceae bacterium]
MSVIQLLAKRLAYAAGLILAVLSINFMLIHAAPGDPAMVIAGEMGGADAATLEQIRKTYGLDRPLGEQYLTYITRAVQGDLGQSYLYNQPVTDLILQRLPATVLLVLSALLTAIAVGTIVGVWASRRPHSMGSGAVTVLSLVGYSMPTFWTG